MNTLNRFSKERFIEFALDCGVLKFGSFTLKSGRLSPYFFNAGLFYHGSTLQTLGQFYANRLIEEKADCRQLFGPAYKGLPLATATAIALAERNINATVTFNRKEAKDHGEGGQLIGAPLSGPVVMIDDVITAGTAFRESQALINANGGRLSTVIIALDRCERGKGDVSTLQEIKAQGINVLSIINFHDLVDYLKQKEMTKELETLEAYRQEYGA
ncbi:orotate phosphoribosyltransferase [Legionella birminghamensis]|uniref:Orotate phosphoribosyltransferase n=1 Tax=Legionella birminghamensis TaxID=28083 RepID=A0A378I9L4_9GAMM|nr:orotate phosphoribosyltransferase [Legionella birminghamensis]KTC74672.1 orotate phosphoribosyltransferase [Legionella birminghamensis]STX31475.1 orotate phosphoribosyltransferase [Legionella birminghamensis]